MTHLKHSRLKDLIDFTDNEINKKILANNGTNKAMLIAIKKGQTLAEHSSDTDAFLLVLDGEIEFSFTEDLSENYTVKKEEILFFPKDKKHKVLSKKDSKILVVGISGKNS